MSRFLGAALYFFYSAQLTTQISDINPELINAYAVLRITLNL